MFQLRIDLLHLKPAIWRRILVPGSIKLPTLHVVLLQTMGWMGGHLHEFVIGDRNYGVPDPDYPEPSVEREDRATLAGALGALKSFIYLYDFGDGWEHRVKVEKILPPDPALRSPVCLAGANACPPEDVGGPPGAHPAACPTIASSTASATGFCANSVSPIGCPSSIRPNPCLASV